MMEAIAALSALAQVGRLGVFRLLVESGPRGVPAGAIAGKLDMALPTLSFHLNQLRHAGLIAQRREGRSLIYSVRFAIMNELMGYLTENCCAGSKCAPDTNFSDRGFK